MISMVVFLVAHFPVSCSSQKALPWGDGKTPLFALAGGWTPEKKEHGGH